MTGLINFFAGQTIAGYLPLTGGNLTGSLGINTPTPAYPLHVNGDIGSYGPSNLWTMNSTSGQAQIILQNNGINGTIIRDDATGSTDIITYGASFRVGAGGVERLQVGTDGSVWLGGDIVGGNPYVDVDGATGQLRINGGTAGEFSFPTAKGTAGQALLSDGAGNTYWGGVAPINAPTFTGAVSVNSGGAAGSNALTVTGGDLVLATSFTPGSQTATGTTGEIAWDSDYLYICVSTNNWGRVAIDMTPF